MLRVRLRVLRAVAANDDAQGEDWGDWDFLWLPRAGDHIDLQRNECTELLAVRRVVHLPTQHPLPRSGASYRQRKDPSICIIAVRAALTRAGISAPASLVAPRGGLPGGCIHDTRASS